MDFLVRRSSVSFLVGLVFIIASCKESPSDTKRTNEGMLSISRISPKEAPVGAQVAIKGKNFSLTESKNTVRFGNKEGTINSVSLGQLKVTVPEGTNQGKVSVTVAVGGKTVTAPEKFTVISGAPAITSFSPQEGLASGTEVVINGHNFSSTASEDTVKFGDIPVTPEYADTDQLKVTVPDGLDTGTVSISFITAGQMATASNKFNVTGHALAISSISPSEGRPGDIITINGSNFSSVASENDVKIGGVKASVESATSTQLKITAPESFTKIKSIPGAGKEQSAFKVHTLTTSGGKLLVTVSVGDNSATTQPANGFTVQPEYSTDNFISHQHNLNVIYFVPDNNPAIRNYKVRWNDLMIYYQDFYISEMNRNGFGEKTFGLPRKADDKKGVKIITIQGEDGYKTYDYGSADKIISEINSYKSNHSEDFHSNYHTLIILPKRPDGGRQPYYGYGNYCFIEDNINMRVTQIPVTNSNLLGGSAHELGHGLNLPHAGEKASQQNTLGTSLMGTGNYTFGREPTFITKANCAILNRNQIFQDGDTPNVYKSVTTSFTPSLISYNPDTKKLHLVGSFTSDKPISNLLFLVDPAGGEGYDSSTWVGKISDHNHFDEKFSIDEIPHYDDTKKYTLKIKLVAQNGSVPYLLNKTFKLQDGRMADSVSVHQHASYNGWSVKLGRGKYTASDLESLGGKDNDISSIKVPFGFTAILYSKDDFSGDSKKIVGPQNIDYLSGFNDLTLSIEIK